MKKKMLRFLAAVAVVALFLAFVFPVIAGATDSEAELYGESTSADTISNDNPDPSQSYPKRFGDGYNLADYREGVLVDVFYDATGKVAELMEGRDVLLAVGEQDPGTGYFIKRTENAGWYTASDAVGVNGTTGSPLWLDGTLPCRLGMTRECFIRLIDTTPGDTGGIVVETVWEDGATVRSETHCTAYGTMITWSAEKHEDGDELVYVDVMFADGKGVHIVYTEDVKEVIVCDGADERWADVVHAIAVYDFEGYTRLKPSTVVSITSNASRIVA